MSSGRLGILVNELASLAKATAEEPGISSFHLRRLLRFLSKVIQVVEQAYQDVLATMIEFKYVTESDKQSGRLKQLEKELELLTAPSIYRDATEICSRLHKLTDLYQSEIQPIASHLSSSNEWWRLLRSLDEHEGYIIELVEDSVFELQRLLREPDVKQINTTAADRVDKVRDSLIQLHSINSQILGLSGPAGLLELTDTREPDEQSTPRVSIGQVQVHFNQIGSQIEESIDLTTLADELSRLRLAMERESSKADDDIAVGEIAQAEQAARTKDSSTLAEHLKAAGKWALDVGTKIGVQLAVEALKQAMKP